MRKYLSDHQYPQEDNCDVYVKTADKKEDVTGDGVDIRGRSGAGTVLSVATLFLTAFFSSRGLQWHFRENK